MKVNILALICLGVITVISSCTNKKGNKEATNTIILEDSISNSDFDEKKVLVIYFSHAGDTYKVGRVKVGNTKIIAGYISNFTHADQFEIIPEKNYDVPYAEITKIVRQEEQDDEYPHFKGKLENIGEYDIVFIGGPIWWGTYPRVMFSFFKEHDLNDKIIIPFTTNEGSGLGNTVEDLKKVYPEATILNGFTMLGQDARKENAKPQTEKWLESLGFRNNKPTEAKVIVKFLDGKEQAIWLATSGAVDLGLSVKWSTCNMDASFPWEVGGHYAWGETSTKSEYTRNSYMYDGKNKDIRGSIYDAAYKMYGTGWRMPSQQELNELLIKSNVAWVFINGTEGYLFTGPNGKNIFMPATGYAYGNEIDDKKSGYYWAGIAANPDNAYVMYFTHETYGVSNYGRINGQCIRPVKE